jgi:hypothetical protein
MSARTSQISVQPKDANLGHRAAKGTHAMTAPQINRVSGRVLIALSVVALLTVLSGYFQAPQLDKGSAAQIFQLSIVLLAPTILTFLATADWARPWRSVRLLAFSGAVVLAAFAALFYLEHYFYLGR